MAKPVIEDAKKLQVDAKVMLESRKAGMAAVNDTEMTEDLGYQMKKETNRDSDGEFANTRSLGNQALLQ